MTVGLRCSKIKYLVYEDFIAYLLHVRAINSVHDDCLQYKRLYNLFYVHRIVLTCSLFTLVQFIKASLMQ